MRDLRGRSRAARGALQGLCAGTFALACALGGLHTSTVQAFSPSPAPVFINELHYDNDGVDTGEAIEIAGPAGTDLNGWSIVLYNGDDGTAYGTPKLLTDTIPNQQGGYGTLSFTFPSNGLQNGDPDGIALMHGSRLVQFLSYEGAFEAVGGPANGITSTNIGVTESGSTPVGFSVQLRGRGSTYTTFTWAAASANSFGEINAGQQFGPSAAPECEPLSGDALTPIYTIQGNAATSPKANQTVTTEGVVTGDFQGGTALGGFFIQDATGDNDATTSDGLFVFVPAGNSFSAIDVKVGDLVRVSGTAKEFNGLTEIDTVTALTVCGQTTARTPTQVDLPAASATDLERYEGMLVAFPERLYVTENFQLARFGQLILSSDARLFQPTNIVDPNDNPASGTSFSGAGNVGAVTALQQANNLRRIILDDASNAENPATTPYLNAQNTRRIGDSVVGLTGVLSFSFGAYRVQPTGAVAFEDTNPRSATPPQVNGNVRVASFNVLNYFNTIDAIPNDSGTDDPSDNVCGPLKNQECRGADSDAEFQRQRAKIFAALRALDADIVGLVELENDGDAADSAIADLVAGLNASIVAVGGPTNVYTYTQDPIGYGPESASALYPGGDDAIKVAFIYKPSRVTPVGQPLASPDQAFENARAPVAQTFRITNTRVSFSVVVNHFKSKSGTGTGANADQNDGQGSFNADRVAQAGALLGFIRDTLIPTAKDPDVLIIGDLNAYNQEDPIDRLRDGGLVNLIDDGEVYSYVFGGQSGSLDHVLATPSLAAQFGSGAKWHINADEPISLDYNVEFKTPGGGTSPDFYQPTPFRSSDHDPILIGLSLNGLIHLPTLMR